MQVVRSLLLFRAYLHQKTSISVSNKIWTCLTALSLFLAVQAYPLGMGLTTTRAAILLSAALLSMRFMLNLGTTFPAIVLTPLYASLVAFVVSTISFFVNDGLMWYSTSWLFLGVLSTFIALCVHFIHQKNVELFFRTVVVCTIVLWIATIGNLLRLNLLSLGGSTLRRWYTENSMNDLNRSMNTMFTYSAILAGITYFNILKPLKWKLVSYIIIFLSLILFILTGSRQNLIALVLYFLLIGFISLDQRTIFSSLLKYLGRFSIMVASFVTIIYYGINSNMIDYTWIQQRFFPFFLEQQVTTGDELRMSLAENAFHSSFENSGLGVGPGNVLGAHNGYLCYIGENGIFMGVVSIIIIFILIYSTMLKGNIKAVNARIVTWAGFIVVSLFLTNVKDLFQEPLYWSLLGLSVGFSANLRNETRHEVKCD